MAFNPSKTGEPLAPPTNSRKNNTNDPGFENKVGYYPYDLSHTEVLAPLFGQVTPSMHLITAMGDRHVVRDDTKTLLNRINGNFLNTINQYVDTFFVSNRTMFPYNWDKLIPNPVKGDDLPNSARPVVPLFHYFVSFFGYDANILLKVMNEDSVLEYSVSNEYVYNAIRMILLSNEDTEDNIYLSNEERAFLMYGIANMNYLTYIISRGQLLDYLGIQLDFRRTKDYNSSFQKVIDSFYLNYWKWAFINKISFYNLEINPLSDEYDFTEFTSDELKTIDEMSIFRERYMSAIERGDLLIPFIDFDQELDYNSTIDLLGSISALISAFTRIFRFSALQSIADVDTDEDFNSKGLYVNIMKPLAYQLSLAQYYTNDSVDNIFTSDLYMQLLRSVMFPSVNGRSSEPTFDYNGVPTEYDLISYGAWYSSLFTNDVPGANSRRLILASLLFTLRRSLRYGDKFTTGRTRMLAVGQLSVPIDVENGMTVNPIDITLGIVSQRFFNAANRVGNKPLNYYASIMGVTPSDMPSIPRYCCHRKITFENRVTTNTANEQGAQTTNLVGYSDNMAFDVFIDDFGVLLSLQSYDVLPIYNSGIDSDNFLSDRFEFFNPMMQNIGDQPIRFSELIGDITKYGDTFAYTVRNAEYKYKLSKSHGVMCYNMPGFLLKFPTYMFDVVDGTLDTIDPDFIRDKPSLLDTVITHNTGASPGDYFHFIVSVHNEVKSARLIQKAPDILF